MNDHNEATGRTKRLLLLAFSLLAFRLSVTMTAVALPLFVAKHYGLGLSLGLVLGLKLAPNVLFGPLVGGVIKRYEPRKIGFITAICSAAVVSLVPFTSTIAQVEILSFLSGVSYMIGYPSRMALRPIVTEQGRETWANGTIVFFQRVSALLGPVLAILSITILNLRAVFFVQSIGAVVAGILMLDLPSRAAQEAISAKGNVWGEMLENSRLMLRRMRDDGRLVGIAVTAVTYMGASSVSQILIVDLAVLRFHSVPGANGYLLEALA